MNNSQVAHAWAHRQSGKGSNFKSDGQTLTSYWTPIAARIDDVIYISADNMSPSTSRHLSHARQAVNHERDKIFYTHAFSRGHRPALTHEAMIIAEVRHIIQELDNVLSKERTRSTTKLAAIETYNSKKAQIVELASRYNVTLPVMPEVHNTEDAVKAYQEAKRLQEEKREAARIKAQKKQQREDKEQFNQWLTTGQGFFPQSFVIRGADQITIYTYQPTITSSEVKQKVITSQGAECPLDHAIKAVRFWQSRREHRLHFPSCLYNHAQDCTCGAGNDSFTPYKTNGHKIPLGIFTLDSIDEAGNVKAGCHTFTRKEIERFINQWREVLGI